jgi:nucleoside 2-deoxyribosyltransferase
MTDRGEKRDAHKPRVSSLPLELLPDLARVAMSGDVKYRPGSWRYLADGSRRFREAALRHLVAGMEAGANDVGPDGSGLPHIAHAAVSCLYAFWHDKYATTDKAVYVAGASAGKERARRVIADCRRRGLLVTLDWPAVHDETVARGQDEANLPSGTKQAVAASCLEGVRSADSVLVLLDEHPSKGMWVEVGYAKALGKRIVVATTLDSDRLPLMLDGHDFVTSHTVEDADSLAVELIAKRTLPVDNLAVP